jgi:dihydroxy-acid dehydratase
MPYDAKPGTGTKLKLRSQIWFDNPDDPDMTALYIERYMNWGITREELQSGKPIIGIAQTGSDLSPCNRQHIVLAQRVREGIREAGGIAFEFPVHPIQETGKRPTAALDRNLAYLGLVEILFGYPARRRGADHRLRQDHAGAADGRRHGQHPAIALPSGRC